MTHILVMQPLANRREILIVFKPDISKVLRNSEVGDNCNDEGFTLAKSAKMKKGAIFSVMRFYVETVIFMVV